MFAIYHHANGWLVDTCNAWAWDVTQAAEFGTALDAFGAIVGMFENGHTDLNTTNCLIIRIREVRA